ncbi:MAG TPA: hypothetical protein VHU19_10870 [Pyrinomonadaceae bacterium]|jgi:hypothetical protein|nr:hypothetical protein [Pyrinomonadaceae bacterium]
MFFDWQTIAVALIIAGAFLYVARRGLARLRSFRRNASGVGAGCATGCGNCGEEDAQPKPVNVLIQISPQGSGRRKSA